MDSDDEEKEKKAKRRRRNFWTANLRTLHQFKEINNESEDSPPPDGHSFQYHWERKRNEEIDAINKANNQNRNIKGALYN